MTEDSETIAAATNDSVSGLAALPTRTILRGAFVFDTTSEQLSATMLPTLLHRRRRYIGEAFAIPLEEEKLLRKRGGRPSQYKVDGSQVRR